MLETRSRMRVLADWLAVFAERHDKALTFAANIWFAIGCADAAGFIHLPPIPFLTGTTGLVAAGAVNAIWYGFVRPDIARRREAAKALPPV